MTGFDHDEATEKPDIAFNVEDNMNTSVGEPVFAEEEVTATEPLAEDAALATADDSDDDGEDRELNAEDDLADEDLEEELLDASAEGETEDDTENESDAELEFAESGDEAVTRALSEELTIFIIGLPLGSSTIALTPLPP
ncbi:MAG: hypothetical protein WCL28_12770, partial [bacterium]